MKINLKKTTYTLLTLSPIFLISHASGMAPDDFQERRPSVQREVRDPDERSVVKTKDVDPKKLQKCVDAMSTEQQQSAIEYLGTVSLSSLMKN